MSCFFSVFKAPRCRCSATCWLFTRWGSFRCPVPKAHLKPPQTGNYHYIFRLAFFEDDDFPNFPFGGICFLVSWEDIEKMRPFQSFRPPKRKRLFRLVFQRHPFSDSSIHHLVAKVCHDFEFSCRHQQLPWGGETTEVVRVKQPIWKKDWKLMFCNRFFKVI